MRLLCSSHAVLRRRADNRILADVLPSLDNSVGLMASADSTTIGHHSDGLEDALTAQIDCRFSADEGSSHPSLLPLLHLLRYFVLRSSPASPP